MKTTNGALLYALLSSAIVIGGCAFGIHKLFDMNLSTWSSPWLWGPVLFFWLAFAGYVLQAAMPIVIARQLENR